MISIQLTTEEHATADRNSQVVIECQVILPEMIATLQFVNDRAVVVQAFVDFRCLELLAVRQSLELLPNLDEAFGEDAAVQVKVQDRTQ